MQGKGKRRKVPLSVGKRNGLTLILDLHSNRAALGSVAKNSDAFNIFIGKVSKKFPKQIPPKIPPTLPLPPKKTIWGGREGGRLPMTDLGSNHVNSVGQ